MSHFVQRALAAIVMAGMLGVFAQHAGGRVEAQGAMNELTIFHAGSLAVPFRDITTAFNKRHPAVAVKAEAAGSRDSARKISDLGRTCDVFGTADVEVVPQLLMPRYADYNIRFATNELAIAYTGRSAHRTEISATNWYRILQQNDVAFGRADPDRDPCGYRALMLFQLAERFYRAPGLSAALAHKDGTRYVRPKETDLLALLETGEIDYLIIYRSVCVQHGLNFIPLPGKINLGQTKYVVFYKNASVKVTGTKPGEFITMIGAPIEYSVTIPKNATNRPMAEAWLAVLLGKAGQDIMRKNGQTPIVPARVDFLQRVPKSLKKYCR